MILFAVMAAVAVFCAVLATAACIGGTALKRRAGGQQAPGSGQAPAPGPGPANPPAGRQQETQPLPPAPGFPPRHGGRVKTVELFADGRLRITDHRTAAVEVRPGFCPDCAAGGDWDAALRDLRKGTP